MDAYLKRYLWVLYICLIGVVAHSASQLAGHFIIKTAIGTLSPTSHSNSTPVKRSNLKPKQRNQWANQIDQRNLFNANPPSPESTNKSAQEEAEKQLARGKLPLPYEDCEDSKLAVTLKVTMVAEPPSASYAMIKVDGKDRIYRINDTIEDQEVVAIQWSGNGQRVVVANQGQFECLNLGKKSAKRSRYTPPKKKNRKNNRSQNNKFKDGIKEISPGNFEVDRAMLDEQLADLDNLVRQARVIPHYKRGKPAGFKVVGIRSNSIFRHLGLKSGDVLKSVGGEELTSINKALGLFEQLKTSDNVSLDLERRGKPLNHIFNIK